MLRRFLPLAVALVLAEPAFAGIIEGTRQPRPQGGVVLPHGKAPRHLECWIDGRRQIVEIDPAQLLPATPESSTRVVIRNNDGTTTVVVMPGPGASGCLPLH